MNVGFVNVYPYRPHGHHAQYLAKMCVELGWQTHALVCDGSPQTCYVRELKGSGKTECVKCRLGSLHTFDFDSVESIARYHNSIALPANENDYGYLVESSAYTLTRIESWEQRQSSVVDDMKKKLLPGALMFYYATVEWINEKRIDRVIAFNGRMDLTRAVVEACSTCGIDYVTHERPLYGHGIILNKNANCSSLRNIHEINKVYANRPLTESQSQIAAKLVAERFIGGNPLEWKRYNANASDISVWPVSGGQRKVLVCPSSKNELLGHSDWETEWKNNTDALDIAVESGWFDYSDLLIRFHPSWAVKFGDISANLCESHYMSWCEKYSVSYVESRSTVNTRDLIRLSDVVVLNGSTTIFEAAGCGKPVICLGSSTFSYSGASVDIRSVEDFARHDYEHIVSCEPHSQIRQAIRYMYSKAAREPLFAEYVRSKTITECDFYSGADPHTLETVVAGSEMIVSDSGFANDTTHEDSVINLLHEGDIESLTTLSSHVWRSAQENKMKIMRRYPYNFVDTVRSLSPKGV